jgi:AraC-like DNA-binding protein
MVGRPDDDQHVPVNQRPRQKQRRLAPDQIADLLVRYTDGTSVLVLAEEYGVHRTTVMGLLEREGIPRRPCTRSMTDDDVARAADQYATGHSLADVAGAFGVSARTVAREFERAGIARRARPGWD